MDTFSAVSSHLLAVLLLLHLRCPLHARAAMDSCYDEDGAPRRCMPKFENVAFNQSVEVSNVCGSPPEEYCMFTAAARSCFQCDASDPERSHNANLLTDFHRNDEPTWWQSQSMFYGVQYPTSVNLTLHLGKAFEITYVRLKFYTTRPESFAIYKRVTEDGPWLPYQHYSAFCNQTYGKDPKAYIRPGGDEKAALCTDEFSDISPLTGGNVAFSTLEGRPSAYNFDQSLVLQEWVTATDLLISLDRLNTFGDEVFREAKVLRSYFYAISDFSVGGRCKCNGHASECVEGEHGTLVCACQHHTAGDDCQRCHPFYQDRPWARATGDSANECLKCNCSGRSDECVFDMEQYRSSGSGGRCLSCRDNTDGPHCERCRENHHRPAPEEPCLPCNCNGNGSANLQCDNEGRCACQPGVTGEKCDTCLAGFHSLGPGGCRPCECDPAGRVGPCSPLDGRCHCKANVEGHSCSRCKPGFFNFQDENPAGCQLCFCFGHSLACTSSSHYAAVNVTSEFFEDQDGWQGEFSGGKLYPLLWKEGEVYLLPLSEEDIGFYKAPEKFLGNQVHSYSQLLFITFTSETPELLPDHVTLLLEGAGITLSADLSAQPALDHDPRLTPRNTFAVRLHEHEMRFKPTLSSFEFQRLLYNLTDIMISNAGGHNYTSQLAGVTLTSAVASSGPPSRPPAPWVESCSCPLGFEGQFCERCAPGFTREPPGAGTLSTCVPCSCHQHGTCHPETGVCECSHFTTGMTCERCLDGYYGNALIGTPGDCQPCPCPDRTSCAQIAETRQVVCTDCPAGQTGMRCQTCEDGYYGDPLGQAGVAQPCVRCDCSGNVDPNALGICDRVTGRCLKCLGHTEGDRCERCRRGYYGDALNQTAVGKCKPCGCNPGGTFGHANECHPETGTCQCLAHVTGRDCGHCQVGFFNLQHGVGCERCQCNPIGSPSSVCHPITGQCVCRAGVVGRLCESCRVGFFGFSSQGCRACNCDPMGSVSMQCHNNGTCVCRQGFVGYKCDKCEWNYFHSRATHQCEECPACYGLIKEKAEKLRARLQDLEKLLAHFNCRGRSGRETHLLKYHMSRLHGPEHQREDALPNALEDFLAFQEAREAFIKQFSTLEASAGTLLAQLHDVTSALNCSISTAEEEGEGEGGGEGAEGAEGAEGRGLCRAFAETALVIGASQRRLKQATLDLDNVMFPFEAAPGPNKWNAMVNASKVLAEGHGEAAQHVEAVASRAARASEQTFSLLMDLLRDNSTEEYIRDLTEQISQMRQHKQNLTSQLNYTAAQQLALEEEAAALTVALDNITSSFHEPAPTDGGASPQPGRTRAADRTAERGNDLRTRAEELQRRVQSQDELIGSVQNKTEALQVSANQSLEATGDVSELRSRAQGAKVTALSSVVAGKEAESDAIALHRELEDMAREWPLWQTQTKAAMKKERPLEEKVLADVRKKTSQIEQLLRPSLENSSLSERAAREAEDTAHTVAKESKAVLSQAKHSRTASTHLSAHLDSALQQLSEHQLLSDAANSQITSEPAPSLSDVKKDMEQAKVQLEAYSLALTELISKLDGSVPLERFDRILNETERRLSRLRGSVESPALGSKIQKLHSASKDQQSRLSVIEKDLQEIREERDSLRDIALNLPQSCPQATGGGRR